MLPGTDGFAVCRALRRSEHWVPVLMLTARDQVKDRIRGLDAGADDYLVKPFDFGELLARLRALIRRGPSERAAGARGRRPARRSRARASSRGPAARSSSRRASSRCCSSSPAHAGEVVPQDRAARARLGRGGRRLDQRRRRLRRLPAQQARAPVPARQLIRTVRGVGFMLEVRMKLPIRVRLTAWYAVLLAAIIIGPRRVPRAAAAGRPPRPPSTARCGPSSTQIAQGYATRGRRRTSAT